MIETIFNWLEIAREMGNSPGLTHLAKKLNKVKGVSFDF